MQFLNVKIVWKKKGNLASQNWSKEKLETD